MRRFLKTILTLSCWYLLENWWIPMWQGLSDFTGFFHHFVLAKLATSSVRVKHIWIRKSVDFYVKYEIFLYLMKSCKLSKNLLSLIWTDTHIIAAVNVVLSDIWTPLIILDLLWCISLCMTNNFLTIINIYRCILMLFYEISISTQSYFSYSIFILSFLSISFHFIFLYSIL